MFFFLFAVGALILCIYMYSDFPFSQSKALMEKALCQWGGFGSAADLTAEQKEYFDGIVDGFLP